MNISSDRKAAGRKFVDISSDCSAAGRKFVDISSDRKAAGRKFVDISSDRKAFSAALGDAVKVGRTRALHDAQTLCCAIGVTGSTLRQRKALYAAYNASYWMEFDDAD